MILTIRFFFVFRIYVLMRQIQKHLLGEYTNTILWYTKIDP